MPGIKLVFILKPQPTENAKMSYVQTHLWSIPSKGQSTSPMQHPSHSSQYSHSPFLSLRSQTQYDTSYLKGDLTQNGTNRRKGDKGRTEGVLVSFPVAVKKVT